ncbi:MAG: hypothetical protein Q9159_000742 [Coniocarpon cinnabarinum]
MWKRLRSKPRSTDATPGFVSGRKLPSESTEQVEEEIIRPEAPNTAPALPSSARLSQPVLSPSEHGSSNTVPRSRLRVKDRQSEPKGLQLLHDPGEDRDADIIFVHGLGGSSLSTWITQDDDATFWPQRFLPREKGLSNSRILTFGYTAFYLSMHSSSKTSIMDFARSLLASLRNEPELAFGQAYAMGRNDDNFGQIIASIAAMVFLGTPHRGSDLAKLLNRLLAVSRIGPSPKQYVADLAEDSPAIEELNEQFRNIPTEIKIASFYETRYSTAAYRKLIVKKESSIIGCRGEISQPLNADHHNICKFASLNDSNYISVRNTLKTILKSCTESSALKPASSVNPLGKVNTLLGLSEVPEDDLDFYYDQRMADTCSWILSEANFVEWMQSGDVSRIFWISGPPGSGKSVLSSFLVNHLRADDINCSYYFFRRANQTQQSVSCFMRSVAFQICTKHPMYRQRLDELYDAGITLENSNPTSIWRKLFDSALQNLRLKDPINIVLDGLDESGSPQTLLALLSSVSFDTPIRFIVVSRSTKVIANAFEKLSASMSISKLSIESSGKDIPMFVERELQLLCGSDRLRRQVMDEIIQRASGNFLWVHFAVKETLSCHTQPQIEEVLHDLPKGMHSFYQRMEEAMTRSLRPADLMLAKALLAFVGCAQRSLNVDELSKVLEPEYSHFIDLRHTINQICGDILVVDRKNRVAFIHETARDFLVKVSEGPLSIDPHASHQTLLLRCMSYLSDPKLSAQVGQVPPPVLLHYASESWAFHLQASSAASEETLVALSEFLQSSSVLIWIKSLATRNQLKLLGHSSQAMTTFVNKRRALDSSMVSYPRTPRSVETIKLWAFDLVKIMGRFGSTLVGHPNSIFQCIAPFCPRDSAINRQFGQKSSLTVHFSGGSHDRWDDRLANILIGAGVLSIRVVTTEEYFVVETLAGEIMLFDCTTFEYRRRLPNHEKNKALCASADGKKVATCDSCVTRVWDLSTGQELHCISNPETNTVTSLSFASTDTMLLSGSDDRTIRRVLLDRPSIGWQVVGSNVLTNRVNGVGVINSPSCIAFDSEGSHVAMSFRGAPLAVFALNDPTEVLWSKRVRETPHSTNPRPWTPVSQVVWHPLFAEVLGIYEDRNVFKWNPFEDTIREAAGAAFQIALSRDGKLFATCENEGSLRIWKYNEFVTIYKLVLEDLPLTCLALSPDNRRLYDVRGSFCNVWEPNILVQLADLNTLGSGAPNDFAGTELSTTTVSEGEGGLMKPVTTLAAAPSGEFYVFGNTEGGVKLFEGTSNQLVEEWTNDWSIELITCSADASYVAWMDLVGKVTVKKLRPERLARMDCQQPSETKFCARIIFEDDYYAQQLLLCETADYMLVAGPTSVQLWSIDNASRITSWNSHDPNSTLKWMNHPWHRDHLLATGADRILACQWQDLVVTSSIEFDAPKPYKITAAQIRRSSIARVRSHLETSAIVENAGPTQNGSYLMVETSRMEERQLMFFPRSAFERNLHHMKPSILPFTVWKNVQLPLGVLRGDKFIFLDNHQWLCSWHLNSSHEASEIKRHFFLPNDFWEYGDLESCRVLENGVMLISRKGEVASIKSDIGLQW